MRVLRYKQSPLLTVFALLFLLAGCDSVATRANSDTVNDYSSNWNDSDSRLVAKEMIQDALSQDWLMKFKYIEGRAPTVIVGTVRNANHTLSNQGQINTATFIADIEHELIHSGKVDFIASEKQRQKIRREVKEQELNVTAEASKAIARQTGADFILKGAINSMLDSIRGEQTRFYQVDLTLIRLSSNQKVWLGQKKIEKNAAQGGFGL